MTSNELTLTNDMTLAVAEALNPNKTKTKLANWCLSNRLTINVKKRKIVLFTRSRTIIKPEAFLNNELLEYQASYKYLAIDLDSYLNFKSLH